MSAPTTLTPRSKLSYPAVKARDRYGRRLLIAAVIVTVLGVGLLGGVWLASAGQVSDQAATIGQKDQTITSVAAQGNRAVSDAGVLATQVSRLGGTPEVTAPQPIVIQGVPGVPGRDGTNGAAGLNGTNGASPPCLATATQCQGSAGTPGQQGAAGAAGPAGPAGAPGASGAAGPAGANGSPATSYTNNFSDGSTQTCTRSGGPDTAPVYSCGPVQPPPSPAPIPGG